MTKIYIKPRNNEYVFLFFILSILNTSKIKVKKYIVINVKKNFIFIKIEKCINKKKKV